MSALEIFVVPALGEHGIATLPRAARIFGTVRLAEDAADHPFGQWSAVLTRTIDPGVFRLSFMSDEAPIHAVDPGFHIKLFRAPALIGTFVAAADD